MWAPSGATVFRRTRRRDVKLVLLAAGRGVRFGGLKQLAPVGPRGEALIDYTARDALAAGYEGVVLVVREEIRDLVASHVSARWPEDLPVDVVVQPARPGTVYAVVSATPAIDGPFTVANADDLYGSRALTAIREHFAMVGSSTPTHVLVAYQLSKTVLTDAEVRRGVCEVGGSSKLAAIREHRVRLRADGRFDALPLTPEEGGAVLGRSARVLDPESLVSMNLWGFSPSILDHLSEAIAPFEPLGPEHEVLLPQVLGDLIDRRSVQVEVIETASCCYGLTHREDVALVREHLDKQDEPVGPACEQSI